MKHLTMKRPEAELRKNQPETILTMHLLHFEIYNLVKNDYAFFQSNKIVDDNMMMRLRKK